MMSYDNDNSNEQNQPMIGMIVPGGPVHTNFTPADSSGQKFALQLTCPGDLPTPLASVNELIFFLLPTSNQQQPLSPNYGIMCYWQISLGTGETTGFELLGTLSCEKPSIVCRTGWSEHEQVSNIGFNTPVRISFGISIEPKETIRNIIGNDDTSTVNRDRDQNRLVVAQKIATDLFTYMQSFDVGASAQQIVVPTNIFDRWMKRFENRFRRDPNFFLKSTTE